jgi:uncharacterized Zn-finger protein
MSSQNNHLKNQPESKSEIVYSTSKKVSCEGGKGASGHPLVYLDMGKEEFITCPYCSKYFVMKTSDQKNNK